MRFLAAPALALMALTTTAHAQTALTPKTLAVLDVLSGGTISNTVDGGTVNVASGGTASSTTILGGGSETISAGGFDTSALISVGGYQLIGAGGEATSTTVAG
jgi:autotransporter passenger strand-loop-strand repeat protein